MSESGTSVPVRMCVRCRATTASPVVVHEVHGASGPGWNVYACPACAPYFPPVPDPLLVLEAAQRNRRGDVGR
ncbi:hypothetical protein [Streptomyces sp. NPDC051776]|uniref:hypothetical protein n=1 Tax=Streptomyces sp. NPDC051776 TaxID=3155414 RepID=UPI0034190C5D